MKIEFSSTGIVLARDQFLSLRGALGVRVACAEGSVWITQDGDPRDVVLAPGDAFVLDRAGPVIVQAFAPALITLVEPTTARRGAPAVGRLPRPAAPFGLALAASRGAANAAWA